MHKIVYFEMMGLKRLVKRGIGKIVYTPQHSTQVIIGSNGSGKSSLLKEMSALPAKSTDYTKTGHKIIHIETQHGLFKLSSHFSPKQVHSFIFNDEELNPGGTMPVQKELVRKHFNLTEKIHRLLLGKVGFTTMRSEEKKEWFTLLNPTSLNYPLQIYAKIKEAYRDITGALKLQKNRLTLETNKTIDADEEQRLKYDLHHAKIFLMDLFNQKPHLTTTLHETDNLITQHNQTLSHLVVEYQLLLKKLKGNPYKDNFTPYEELESEKITLEVTLRHTRERISQCYDRITKLEEERQTLEGMNGKDLGQIEVERLIVQQKMNELDRLLQTATIRPQYRDVKEIDAIIHLIENIDTPLIALLVDLPINPDRRYNSEYLRHLEVTHKERSVLIEALNQDTTSLAKQLKEYEEIAKHNLTECPNCNHQWVRDYDSNAHQTLMDKHKRLLSQLESEKQLLLALEPELETVRQYGKVIYEYRRFVNTYPKLSPLWSYVESSGLLYENPSKITTVLHGYKDTLHTLAQYHLESIKYEELNSLHKKLKETQSQNLTDIQCQIEKSNHELHTLNMTLHRTQLSLGHLRTYSEMLVKFDALTKQIDVVSADRRNQYEEHIRLLHRDMINHLIQETQLRITQIEHQLSRIHSQKEIIAHIEKEIVQLEDKEQYLKLALQSMSPVDGLIAKGSYGFINTFISQMNHFIKKIWLTPLELSPLEVSEDNEIELDYTFSAKIHDGVVPDINECSRGESEIINIAFVIVAMHYLGMSEYPLYLDEFASNMDPKHKDSAFHAMIHLMGNSRFSQLFIVSHFEKFYSSMKNNDTIVFCSENVYIPDTLKYNSVISFFDYNEGTHNV